MSKFPLTFRILIIQYNYMVPKYNIYQPYAVVIHSQWRMYVTHLYPP